MAVLPRLKAVYFDLDDTLCGYWDASKKALRQAFEAHPIEGYTPEEMVEHWAAAFREYAPTLKGTESYQVYLKNGKPTRDEQMAHTLRRVGVDDARHAEALGDTYGAMRNANLRLFDDALEVLTALKASHPLGVITNGPADTQRQELETLDLERWFDHVFIEGELGIGKPNRIVFEKAEKAVGAKPEELLFVGNSYAHDIRPAINFGWHTAWIRRDSDVPPSVAGQTTKPESKPEGAPEPTFVIHQLRDLLDIVQL